MDFNILVGGAAGQGVDTVAKVLELIMKKQGVEVFSHKDYMSRVRGGHNFHQIRFSDRPIYSHRDTLDVILALDATTVELHSSRLSAEGVLVNDESAGESHGMGRENTPRYFLQGGKANLQ